MSRVALVAAVAAAAAIVGASPARADDPPAPAPAVEAVREPPPREPDADPLTRGEWQPRPAFDLHWRVLDLPGTLLSLALTPFRLAVGAIERNRLDKRIFAFLTFYNDQIKIAPQFKVSFGDGLGGGIVGSLRGMNSPNSKITIGWLYRIDRDWELDFEYRHRLLLPGGRGIKLKVHVERDINERYFGITGASEIGDRRVIGVHHFGGTAEMDLLGVDRYDYAGLIQLGVQRELLTPGISATHPPVGEPGDMIVPPPGFQERIVYGDIRLVGRIDTRDAFGRPTRGNYAEVAVHARADVARKRDLSAVSATAELTKFLPVGALGRVLALHLGGAATSHIIGGDQVPFEAYPTLGREHGLRGYERDRFRDRYELHGSAEYRYPIYEFLSTKAGLDSFFFLDVGTAFGVAPLAASRVHYSLGTGIRAGHETTSVFQFTFGWSPEGTQITLNLGSKL
jgi:hypothetical protein